MENKIEDLLGELLDEMVLETKESTFASYHGSHKGEEIPYTLYFDENGMEWTTQSQAIQGYILKRIKPTLSKLISEKKIG